MTTPFERTRALIYAGEFLEVLRAAGLDKVPAEVRERADHILRHYPSNMEIGWMAHACQNAASCMPVLDPSAVSPELRKGYRR